MDDFDLLHQRALNAVARTSGALTGELRLRLLAHGFVVASENTLVSCDITSQRARETALELPLQDPATQTRLKVGVLLRTVRTGAASEVTHDLSVLVLVRPRSGPGSYVLYQGFVLQGADPLRFAQQDEPARQAVLNHHAQQALRAVFAHSEP